MPARKELNAFQAAMNKCKEDKEYDKGETIDHLVEALLLMESSIESAHEEIQALKRRIEEKSWFSKFGEI